MWRAYTILCIGRAFFRNLISNHYRGVEKLTAYAYIKTYPNDPILIGILNHGLGNWLFQHSEKNPPLEEQLYLFMKRFRTQPSEFFNLGRELRLSLYFREMEVVKAEYDKVEEIEAEQNKT